VCATRSHYSSFTPASMPVHFILGIVVQQETCVCHYSKQWCKRPRETPWFATLYPTLFNDQLTKPHITAPSRSSGSLYLNTSLSESSSKARLHPAGKHSMFLNWSSFGPAIRGRLAAPRLLTSRREVFSAPNFL
jgi:hypothetical protein